jgi:hypothetical protein
MPSEAGRERIRCWRLFYQKITDIYATSIDYDADAEFWRRLRLD